MKILVLDDIRFRHDTFDHVYDQDDVYHAYTYSDFLAQLHNGSPWDLLHLDHDLGDFVNDPDTYVDGWGIKREYNGQHATSRVCELSDELLPKRVIVHSINPAGAKAMCGMLERRGVPVVWDPFNEIVEYDNNGNPMVII